MSKQLAISASLSIIAMIGLAIGAPAIVDELGAGEQAGTELPVAVPAVLAD